MSIETPEFAAMMARMVRAYGRRVAAADPEDLADMITVQRALDAAIREAVRGQHDAGRSWAEISKGLGTTRQSAHATYGRAVFGRADVA